jgi:hypothetical protein
MKKSTLLLAVLCCLNFTVMAQNNNAFAVQTTIQNGIIEGDYDTKSGIQTYFGVPFAQPPVGNLRWKAPQPVTNWTGVKQTKTFAPRPMQKLIWGDMVLVKIVYISMFGHPLLVKVKICLYCSISTAAVLLRAMGQSRVMMAKAWQKRV